MKETVVFKQHGDIKLCGDLHLPKRINGELRPAVVVVHGGGWAKRAGEMTLICKKLVRAGFVAFNITYRLAPEFRHPSQFDDVNTALDWLFERAGQYGIDPQRISGWGYSAGAHLILLAGLQRAEGSRLSAIVAGGTPADLSRWPNSPLVTGLIGRPMIEAEAEWQAASPLNYVSEHSPAVFLYHGLRDTLVEPEQMHLLADALQEQGARVQTHGSPLFGHIAMYLLGFSAQNQAIKFLQANG
ncbi:alpha/beta hydrolase [Spongiibacter sp. KMU-158]|uniref:Alpha/beta hydrolase n=1 Tax=Spongiibacter pelagi TaxID=2760804 RepID=A0A927BYY1_9GAMM|nr:alpha/beta hydrolase [Spongiibacter pelagi]MBD2858149.1 alpha/beta hydrolase [Spongiibacter pelagi]